MATVNRPVEMTDMIQLHGEMMTLEKAEQDRLVNVLRDSKGEPIRNSSGELQYQGRILGQ